MARRVLTEYADATGLDGADLRRRVSDTIGRAGDPDAAMALLEQAIAVYEDLPGADGLVDALVSWDLMSWAVSRYEEGRRACARALAASAEVEDAVLRRKVLSVQAQHDADAGDVSLARSRFHEATTLRTLGPDRQMDVMTAVLETNVLLLAEAGADAVVEAGRLGLEALSDWGLGTYGTSIVVANLSSGLRQAGRPAEAAALVDPLTVDAPTVDQACVHFERALLDLLRGEGAAARERMGTVTSYYSVVVDDRIVLDCGSAAVHLWLGRPEEAYARLVRSVRDVATDPWAIQLAEPLALAARAAADVAQAGQARASGRHAELRALAGGAARDPFEPHPGYAARPAWRATYEAELHRLSGGQEVAPWLSAALAWDVLDRPHDAAYCRWRAARAAVAAGRGTSAVALLDQARRQARGHQPLLDAIAADRERPLP
jgi:hypothetical protein